ncbi:molybdate transport system substrate-binding protein [Herbihabitans rhizosphaerae]|uniref:Molybdate transport system substrate-binding protein n=1 Tax=Herbihabitans rhizosphaerae TaxID=1872711 RepID=A0A4V2ETG9_9PSEU|nr:molybdate ABC transporter substrate-binding protein [Herbihabitans rhizosphaerae]RZS41033.1 molybdate transport system substrate-binding protein [Herbihabitans rhizosphaerae]
MKRLMAAATLLLAVAGCGTSGGEQARTVTVLAAASLTEPFGAIERAFEAANPGVDVKISYQGSSALAQQIVNGAPADVFASADTENMDKVTGAGLADGTPTVFATNRLMIVVRPGNPKRITGLADLARADVTLVLCAPKVPCGAAARRAAGTTPLRPASEEQDVKAVLNKVRAGEADAGLVYVTDVRSAGAAVRGVDFPESAGAINRYPIAAISRAPRAGLGRAFLAMVTSPAGRAELDRFGFGAP